MKFTNPTLMKAQTGGPFIGPRGGKWADPQHTVPWHESHTVEVQPHDKIGMGGRKKMTIHVSKSDKPDHVRISQSTAEFGGTHIPAASLHRMYDDLEGKVRVGRSRHPAIDAVATGKAKFIGKGDDGMAFKHGDVVAKASTTVPYQPFSPHRTPEAANDMMRSQVEIQNKMHAAGVPTVKSEYVEHDGRGFQIRPHVDIPKKLTRAQLDEAQESIHKMHDAGYALQDEVQVGLHEGKVVLFDTGKAAEIDADDDKRGIYSQKAGDIDGVRHLYRAHGETFVNTRESEGEKQWNRMDDRLIKLDKEKIAAMTPEKRESKAKFMVKLLSGITATREKEAHATKTGSDLDEALGTAEFQMEMALSEVSGKYGVPEETLEAVWNQEKERAAAKIQKGGRSLDLLKAHTATGPFIGPRGGKWADAAHTVPYAGGREGVAQLQTALKEKHGIKLALGHHRGITTLHSMVVPPESRGKGTGDAVMHAVKAHADAHGHTTALTADPALGGGRGSKARLVKWYKRHGFVENKGRNKDYEISEGMHRMPTMAKGWSELADLFKAKYKVRFRNPNAPPNWRYVYDVAQARRGKGLAHESEMKVGARYKIEAEPDDGRKMKGLDPGHVEIVAREGDIITVKHTDTGQTEVMTTGKFRRAMHEQHWREIHNRERARTADLHAARLFGSTKQKLRAREYMRQFAKAFDRDWMELLGEPPEDAPKPKRPPANYAERKKMLSTIEWIEKMLPPSPSYDERKNPVKITPAMRDAGKLVNSYLVEQYGLFVDMPPEEWREHPDALAANKAFMTRMRNLLGERSEPNLMNLMRATDALANGESDTITAGMIGDWKSTLVSKFQPLLDYELARNELTIDSREAMTGAGSFFVNEVQNVMRRAYYEDGKGSRTGYQYVSGLLAKVRTKRGLQAVATLTAPRFDKGKTVPSSAARDLISDFGQSVGKDVLERLEKLSDQGFKNVDMAGFDPVPELDALIESDRRTVREIHTAANNRHAEMSGRAREELARKFEFLYETGITDRENQAGIVDQHFTSLTAENSKVKQLFRQRFGVQIVLDDRAFSAFVDPEFTDTDYNRVWPSSYDKDWTKKLNHRDKKRAKRWMALQQSSWGIYSIRGDEHNPNNKSKAAANEFKHAAEVSVDARKIALRNVWHALARMEKTVGGKLDLHGIPMVIADDGVSAGANAHYAGSRHGRDLEADALSQRVTRETLRRRPHIAIGFGMEKAIGHEIVHYLNNRTTLRANKEPEEGGTKRGISFEWNAVAGKALRAAFGLNSDYTKDTPEHHMPVGVLGMASASPSADANAAILRIGKALDYDTKAAMYQDNVCSWLLRHQKEPVFQTPDGKKAHKIVVDAFQRIPGGSETWGLHKAVHEAGGYTAAATLDAGSSGDMAELLAELQGRTLSKEEKVYWGNGAEVTARAMEQLLHSEGIESDGRIHPGLTRMHYDGKANFSGPSPYYEPDVFKAKIAPAAKRLLKWLGNNMHKGQRFVLTLSKGGGHPVGHLSIYKDGSKHRKQADGTWKEVAAARATSQLDLFATPKATERRTSVQRSKVRPELGPLFTIPQPARMDGVRQPVAERHTAPVVAAPRHSLPATHPALRPEFKAWFGDWERGEGSKVVKADQTPAEQFGEAPVPMYHGTAVGGFQSFSKDKDKGQNIYGHGFYFTADKGIATEYTKKDEKDRELSTTHFADASGKEIEWLTREQAAKFLESAKIVPVDKTTDEGRHSALPTDYEMGFHNGSKDYNALHAVNEADDGTGRVHVRTLIKRLWSPAFPPPPGGRYKGYGHEPNDMMRSVNYNVKPYDIRPQLNYLKAALGPAAQAVAPDGEVFEVYMNIRNPLRMSAEATPDKVASFAASYVEEKAAAYDVVAAQIEDLKAEKTGAWWDYRTDAERIEEGAKQRREGDAIRKGGASFYGDNLVGLLGHPDDKSHGRDSPGHEWLKANIVEDYSVIPIDHAALLKMKQRVVDNYKGRKQKHWTGQGEPRQIAALLFETPRDVLTWGDVQWMTTNCQSDSQKEPLNNWAKAQGHDGIHHIGGWNIGAKSHDVWIAWEPNQLKSPDSESFNPQTDNIYKGMGWAEISDLIKGKHPVGHVSVYADGSRHRKQSDGKWKEITPPKDKRQIDLFAADPTEERRTSVRRNKVKPELGPLFTIPQPPSKIREQEQEIRKQDQQIAKRRHESILERHARREAESELERTALMEQAVEDARAERATRALQPRDVTAERLKELTGGLLKVESAVLLSAGTPAAAAKASDELRERFPLYQFGTSHAWVTVKRSAPVPANSSVKKLSDEQLAQEVARIKRDGWRTGYLSSVIDKLTMQEDAERRETEVQEDPAPRAKPAAKVTPQITGAIPRHVVTPDTPSTERMEPAGTYSDGEVTAHIRRRGERWEVLAVDKDSGHVVINRTQLKLGASRADAMKWLEQKLGAPEDRLSAAEQAELDEFKAERAAKRAAAAAKPAADRKRFAEKAAAQKRMRTEMDTSRKHHADTLASMLTAAGIRARSWHKPTVGSRVYMPGGGYYSIDWAGGASAFSRGTETYNESALYPSQRKKLDKVLEAHATVANQYNRDLDQQREALHAGANKKPAAMDTAESRDWTGKDDAEHQRRAGRAAEIAAQKSASKGEDHELAALARGAAKYAQTAQRDGGLGAAFGKLNNTANSIKSGAMRLIASHEPKSKGGIPMTEGERAAIRRDLSSSVGKLMAGKEPAKTVGLPADAVRAKQAAETRRKTKADYKAVTEAKAAASRAESRPPLRLGTDDDGAHVFAYAGRAHTMFYNRDTGTWHSNEQDRHGDFRLLSTNGRAEAEKTLAEEADAGKVKGRPIRSAAMKKQHAAAIKRHDRKMSKTVQKGQDVLGSQNPAMLIKSVLRGNVARFTIGGKR